ncbi:MAG TPA: 50S ribosomal protein L13 [Chloroflexota bacterium]
MKTHAVKAGEIERAWHVVDADGIVLGRLATQVAALLRGKHKPIYSPNADTGDFVVVVNAARVRVTGTKESAKTYYRHSGYPGGLKAQSLQDLRSKFPERIVERAVKGMLPHNALGKKMYSKLRVYPGASHPHGTNHPQPLELPYNKPAAATR